MIRSMVLTSLVCIATPLLPAAAAKTHAAAHDKILVSKEAALAYLQEALAHLPDPELYDNLLLDGYDAASKEYDFSALNKVVEERYYSPRWMSGDEARI